MRVSAQISLYPLRQQRLGPAIDAFRRVLEREGLEVQLGPMSTLVTGPTDRLFPGLQRGFEEAGSCGHIVLVVTVSNACPIEPREPGDVGAL